MKINLYKLSTLIFLFLIFGRFQISGRLCATNIQVKNTPIQLAPAINCATTTMSNSQFTHSGLAQNAVLTLGLTNATAGALNCVITSSGNDFTPSIYKTTVTAGQKSVAIPLVFDGSSVLTYEIISVVAANYSGNCNLIVKIVPAPKPTLNCATTSLNKTVFTNNKVSQNAVLTLGLTNAMAGVFNCALTSSGNDFTPSVYRTIVTTGQKTVVIPIVFDGTSTLTFETITVVANNFLGNCSQIIAIKAPPPTRFVQTQRAQHIPIVVTKISPNPSEDVITVELESWDAREVTFNFSDAFGKTVKTDIRKVEKGINRVLFDVFELPQGIYFIAPSTSMGRNMPTKFVKM